MEPLHIDLRQPPFAEPATTDLGYIRYRHRDFEEVQRRRDWRRALEQLRQHAVAWSHAGMYGRIDNIWSYGTPYPMITGISLYTDPDHILADALGWTDGPLPAFVAEYVDLLGGFRVE